MNVGFKGTGRYVLVRLGAGSGEDVADGMRVGEAATVGEEVGGMVEVEVGRYVLVRLVAGSGEDVADGMRVGEAATVGEEVG